MHRHSVKRQLPGQAEEQFDPQTITGFRDSSGDPNFFTPLVKPAERLVDHCLKPARYRTDNTSHPVAGEEPYHHWGIDSLIFDASAGHRSLEVRFCVIHHFLQFMLVGITVGETDRDPLT